MTCTAVVPQNQYKKVVALSKDKELDGNTCSWQRAYQNVKKYKLFSLRQTCSIRLQNDYHKKKKEDEIFRIKYQVYKVQAQIKHMQPVHTPKQLRNYKTNSISVV